MVKKIILAVIIFVGFLIIGSVVFIHYQRNKSCPSETKTVQLSQPSDLKTIILETKNVIATFGLSDIKSRLTQSLKENPDWKADSNFLAFIEEQAKKNNKINVSDYHGGFLETPAGDHLTAGLLDEGKIILFNKDTNTFVNKIKIVTYGDKHSGLCHSGGRTYYLPDGDVIFFAVMDWIE